MNKVHLRLPQNSDGNYVCGVGYVRGAPARSFCGKLLQEKIDNPTWEWFVGEYSTSQKDYCKHCLNRVAR